MRNMIRFNEQSKTDKRLHQDVLKMVQDIEKSGIPRTIEGLSEMYRLYNKMFGQNKKLNNCIYCRKNVSESLSKAVLLLDIKPEKKTVKKSSGTTKKRRTTKKKTTTKK